jgi:Domain of unknown function (DUF5050)
MSNPDRSAIAFLIAAASAIGVADAEPRVAAAPRTSTAHVRAIDAPPHAALAVDGFVYWTQPTAEPASRTELWRAALDGRERGRLGSNAGYALATDGGSVYYTDVENLAIRAFDTHAGTYRILARTRAVPISITAGGGFVYWTERDDAGMLRIPAAGGPVVRLAVAGPESPIVADASDVYTVTHGTLVRIAHGASAPAVVTRGLRGADEIALDSASVYVTAGDALYRTSKNGSTPIRIGRAGLVNQLASVGETVYWTSADDPRVPDGDCRGFEVGTVRRVEGGSAPKVIVTGCDLRGVVAGAHPSFVLALARLVPFDPR